MKSFQPDYRNLEMAARNVKPPRLPFYEHYINNESMEAIEGFKFGELLNGGPRELEEFFRLYNGFFLAREYDTVSYECCICGILPGAGALGAHKPGAIHSRADFESYPWDELPELYWKLFGPRLAAMAKTLPAGMKAVGGVGNGPFEIAEDLVGYENLCLLQADDPELFSELFVKIGDLHLKIWKEFLRRHADNYAVCRIGDDMGFKTQTLLAPATLIEHVVPQYKRIIARIHAAGKPFLLHSCGKIFDIMEPLIEAGIDAKHSNEDAIAHYGEWIERYGSRIGLFGGIDTDRLCRLSPQEIKAAVLEEAAGFRAKAGGYALGSGNSIPPYVPPEGYLAMIEAGQELRRREAR